MRCDDLPESMAEASRGVVMAREDVNGGEGQQGWGNWWELVGRLALVGRPAGLGPYTGGCFDLTVRAADARGSGEEPELFEEDAGARVAWGWKRAKMGSGSVAGLR